MALSKKKTSKKPTQWSLPTEPSEPRSEVFDFSYFIHGEKKIGKTTFANKLANDNAITIQCDREQRSLSVMEVVCRNWKDSRDAIKELLERSSKNAFPWDAVIVDGVDLWYNDCQSHVCQKMKIDHPSDEGFARAWHALRDDFTDAVRDILSLPCGAIFISHSDWQEKKTRLGATIQKLIPNLSKRAEEILNGMTDMCMAYDYDENRHVAYIAGDESISAGHSINGRFITTDGRAVREIDMGSSEDEAVENFMAAFNNEQEYVTIKEMIKPRMTKKKTKKKSTR